MDDGGSLGGGSCTAADWRCLNGVLDQTATSGTDSCGGTEDDPSVTYYSCVASDGVLEDLCIDSSTLQSDSCVDTGGSLGGGSCSAIDWYCVDGFLASNSSSGLDLCVSETDVAHYACSNSDGAADDSCVAAVDTCADICLDGACTAGAAVPVLPTTGLIALASLLALLGHAVIRRRQLPRR